MLYVYCIPSKYFVKKKKILISVEYTIVSQW